MLTIRPFVSKNLVDLQRVVGPNDYIINRLRRTETGGSATYMAWPSATSSDIYQYASSLPVKQRALHSLFGRPGVPMDFCADLDLPFDPSDRQKRSYGFDLMKKVCDEASVVLHDSFEQKFEKLVVLQSFSQKKLSYHIHARVNEHTAFTDFKSVAKFSNLLQEKLDRDSLYNVIDSNIYRANGSLRLYDCVKSIGDDITLSHVAHKYPENWDPLPEELFDLSLVMRRLVTITRKLEYEAEKTPSYTKRKITKDDIANDLNFIAANVPNLRKQADEYKSWIGISLVLKSCELYVRQHPEFEAGHNYRELFHSFSKLSSKYDFSQCENWWNKFKVNNVQIELSAGYIRKIIREQSEK